MSDHWKELGESPYPYEKEALAWVRSWFPEREPWHAFARFSFLASDGRDYEIDLLIAGPTGCFIIEIKGHEGVISGSSLDLMATSGSRKNCFDHPGRQLKPKMDKLIRALQDTKAYKGKSARPPFIENLVFFSHADALQLTGASAGVLLRDREGVIGLKAAIMDRNAPWMRRLADGERRIDKPAARHLTNAMLEVGHFGIKQPIIAGSWKLEPNAIEETTIWRDYEASHQVTNDKRTIRIYTTPRDLPLDGVRLENAAKLEFEALRAFEHPGVVRALELVETDFGWAIIFEPTKNFVRLDRFMQTRGSTLDFTTRLWLVRQLCEAVSAAHDRGLAHRGLMPTSILVVDPDSPKPSIKIRNWNWRIRTDASDQGSIKTFGGQTLVDLSPFAEEFTESERTFLAPEMRGVGETGGIPADIFSLGALAFLIFTSNAPAQTLASLDVILQTQQHLAASQFLNGASSGLEHFIARSAHASPLQRAATARELLETLDKVSAELDQPEVEITGPDDLINGSKLDEDTTVVRRLGSGGTAVGFEVLWADRSYALKVARNETLNDRIDREAEALRALKHDHIVSLESVTKVGKCSALLLSPFGQETLHDYLKRVGPPQFEFLERWGTQILSAVEHLEQRGIAHRDIKPGNIAVTDRGTKKQLQVALFDFSLAKLPADNLNAGTPGYIDPFLGSGNRRQWDQATERYSAAITLYEMTTGIHPKWGDGKTLPSLLPVTERILLEPDLFPAEVRQSLLTFFERALQRDSAKRFEDATTMREAWQKAMAGSTVTVVGTSVGSQPGMTLAQALDEAKAQAGIATIVTSLPLSPSALNALNRLSVDTIGQLLHYSPHALRWLEGVGRATQNELSGLFQEARVRFPEVEVTIRSFGESPVANKKGASAPNSKSKSPAAQARTTIPSDATLGVLARSLRERDRDGESRSNDAMADYLGLSQKTPEGNVVPAERSQMQPAAEKYGLTRAAVYIALDGASKRWQRIPAFKDAATAVHEIVTSMGGVATIHEVAAAITTRLPVDTASTLDQRRADGFSVALAVAEAEHRTQENPRFKACRAGKQLFLTSTSDSSTSYAIELGKKADEIANNDNTVMLAPGACISQLRTVVKPEELPELSNERILSLATSTSAGACLNSRGELYPRGLSAARALKLTQGALAGLGKIDSDRRRRTFSIQELRERISQRYPEAEILPEPSECLAMVKEVLGQETSFDVANNVFVLRMAESMTVQTGSDSHQTMYITQVGVQAGVQPIDSRQLAQRNASEFESAIHSAIIDRRLVVVRVPPAKLSIALSKIQNVFQLRHLSVDKLFVDGLRKVSNAKRIEMTNIYDADAAWPAGPGVLNLKAVLAMVRKEVIEPAIFENAAQPILLSGFGLLFRYQQDSLYTALRDACSAGQHPGAICVVPADPAAQTVVLDGMQFPEFDSSRIFQLPSAWLRGDAA